MAAEDGPMTFPPATPTPRGPNPTRAAFFREAAGAFEFLALWHGLDIEEQEAVRAALHDAAQRMIAKRGKK